MKVLTDLTDLEPAPGWLDLFTLSCEKGIKGYTVHAWEWLNSLQHSWKRNITCPEQVSDWVGALLLSACVSYKKCIKTSFSHFED